MTRGWTYARAGAGMDKYMFGLLRDTEDRIEGRNAFKENASRNTRANSAVEFTIA